MAGWSIDVVAPGCVWYNYTGFYLPTGANQTINVLEIDLSHGGYSLSVVHSEEADSLSAFALRADAFAGINGSYFEPGVSFVKTDGKVRREVTVDKNPHPLLEARRGILPRSCHGKGRHRLWRQRLLPRQHLFHRTLGRPDADSRLRTCRRNVCGKSGQPRPAHARLRRLPPPSGVCAIRGWRSH